MKKLLKWSIIGILGVVGLLMFIASMSSQDKTKASKELEHATQQNTKLASVSTATSANVSKPIVATNYPIDQCLDGICLRATPSEVSSMNWREKEVVKDGDLSQQQRELLDIEEKALMATCVLQQQVNWQAKAEEVCKFLIRGASNFVPYEYRPVQMAKVLGYFAETQLPVCSFTQEALRIVGHVKTETGLTKAEWRFDTSGKLRVYAIEKGFADQNEETNSAIVSKLLDKHPYLSESTNSRAAERIWTGEGARGGSVRMIQRAGAAPSIDMKANTALFDWKQVAACKAVKAVSVE